MLQALAVVTCAFAVVTDVRDYRIPNRVILPGLFGGLLLDPSPTAVLAGGIALVVFGVPAAFDKIGMGDVKLAAAVATLLRWPLVLPFLLDTALAGGIVALVFALLGRRRMPYALAIAAGCIWAIASRYAPVLRVL
jgi:prepilin peptidase CpaA